MKQRYNTFYIEDGKIQVFAGANILQTAREIVAYLNYEFKDKTEITFNGVDIIIHSRSYPPDIVEIYNLKASLHYQKEKGKKS